MAIRNIRIEGDDILRKTSRPINEMTARNQELVDDMIESLASFNGVGLAAVQVGVLKRLCIINIEADEEEEVEESEYARDTKGEDLVVINPEVIPVGEETQTGTEGCLSVPKKWGTVTRPMRVILKAQDRNLKPYELKAEGLLARCICHECDHMDGRMYIDIVEGPIESEDDGE